MLTPGVLWMRFAISYRVATCPPAECPAMTILVRLGKSFLLASLMTSVSRKPNAVSVGLVGEAPPDRQFSPPSGHITSFGAGLSLDAMKCGATMMVFSRAPAMKPAAID